MPHSYYTNKLSEEYTHGLLTMLTWSLYNEEQHQNVHSNNDDEPHIARRVEPTWQQPQRRFCCGFLGFFWYGHLEVCARSSRPFAHTAQPISIVHIRTDDQHSARSTLVSYLRISSKQMLRLKSKCSANSNVQMHDIKVCIYIVSVFFWRFGYTVCTIDFNLT